MTENEARYLAQKPVHWIKLIDPRWGELMACGVGSEHKKTDDKSAVTCLSCLSILGLHKQRKDTLEKRKAAR